MLSLPGAQIQSLVGGLRSLKTTRIKTTTTATNLTCLKLSSDLPYSICFSPSLPVSVPSGFTVPDAQVKSLGAILDSSLSHLSHFTFMLLPSTKQHHLSLNCHNSPLTCFCPCPPSVFSQYSIQSDLIKMGMRKNNNHKMGMRSCRFSAQNPPVPPSSEQKLKSFI